MTSIALVTENTSAASLNTRLLTAALCASTPKTIHLPPGTIYFNGTSTTLPVTSCGRIISRGAGGYGIVPTDPYGRINTRLVQLGAGPLLRISGTGFILDGSIEMVGLGSTDSTSAIEIEGRSLIATGRHRFTNIVFRNWGRAFRCMAGYYDGNAFVDDESHADNCIVSGCETANVATFFRSENQQALNWVLRDCMVNDYFGPTDQVVCDIVRGGCISIERLAVEHFKTTIFQLTDYSPNNRQLTCTDTFVDRMWDNPGAYLKLIKYVGTDPAFAWSMDFTGFVADYLQTFPVASLFDVPEDFPMDEIRYRLTRSTGSLTNS